MIRWMCGISMTEGQMKNGEGWLELSLSQRYEHVMRKSDEDWVKKCMEYRVEGRRTWLESVEAELAEIEKEDAHDRKKWRKNVMKGSPTLLENRL